MEGFACHDRGFSDTNKVSATPTYAEISKRLTCARRNKFNENPFLNLICLSKDYSNSGLVYLEKL